MVCWWPSISNVFLSSLLYGSGMKQLLRLAVRFLHCCTVHTSGYGWHGGFNTRNLRSRDMANLKYTGNFFSNGQFPCLPLPKECVAVTTYIYHIVLYWKSHPAHRLLILAPRLWETYMHFSNVHVAARNISSRNISYFGKNQYFVRDISYFDH